jgi:hypothetical protein
MMRVSLGAKILGKELRIVSGGKGCEGRGAFWALEVVVSFLYDAGEPRS